MRKAADVFNISYRRGCGLLRLNRSSFHYGPKARADERVLRMRLCELAAVRVRYGYRRLTILLRREGWLVSPKRVYRIYKAEGLKVRTKQRVKRASQPRVPLSVAAGRHHRWSMDFMADKLVDGRRFRVLTVIDHFDRSCPVLYADQSIGAAKVINALEQAAKETGGIAQGHHDR